MMLMTWVMIELVPSSQVILRSYKTNLMARRRVSWSSESLRRVFFASPSLLSRCQRATTSFPSFSLRAIQTRINHVKEPAGKLKKDGESKQNLTIHLALKPAHLGIQEDDLRSSRSNLHSEVNRHRLGLEL
jgi:hypothetical protein